MMFSVITATLQSGNTLKRALQSLLGQTCHDLEHIIVDGGSVDNTLQIAHEYARTAPYPVQIIQQQGCGVYDALNQGVAAAKGEIVVTLHADDRLYDRDILQDVSDIMKDSNIAVCYGDVLYTSGRHYSAKRFSPESLLEGFAPPHPGMFIRREMFDKYGLYDTHYLSAGDFDLMVRILLDGGEKSHYIPAIIQEMDSGGRSSSWRYRLCVNLQEKRRSLKANGHRAPWHRLLRRYLY